MRKMFWIWNRLWNLTAACNRYIICKCASSANKAYGPFGAWFAVKEIWSLLCNKAPVHKRITLIIQIIKYIQCIHCPHCWKQCFPVKNTVELKVFSFITCNFTSILMAKTTDNISASRFFRKFNQFFFRLYTPHFRNKLLHTLVNLHFLI